jgi:hypothetical protein
MQQEKFQSLRCHCLAALGIIHQIAQVRLLNRPDVRLLAPACVAKHEIIVSLPKFIIEASNTSNRNRSNASTQKKIGSASRTYQLTHLEALPLLGVAD